MYALTSQGYKTSQQESQEALRFLLHGDVYSEGGNKKTKAERGICKKKVFAFIVFKNWICIIFFLILAKYFYFYNLLL